MTPAKSGRPGRGLERCLWKSLKISGFPIFSFSGGAKVEFGRAKKCGQEENPKRLQFAIKRWRPVINLPGDGRQNRNLG